jgi:hypothetical protein
MICDTTNTDIIMINGSNEQDGILLNMKKKVKNIMIYYHHYTTQIKRSVPLTSVGWDLQLQKNKHEDDKIKIYARRIQKLEKQLGREITDFSNWGIE